MKSEKNNNLKSAWDQINDVCGMHDSYDEELKPLLDLIKDQLEKSFDEKEMVNHPKHYNSHPSGIECIDIIRHFNFNIGSAIKYLWRCGLKDDEIQELEKAKWYIDDEIKRRKNELKSKCNFYVDVVSQYVKK